MSMKVTLFEAIYRFIQFFICVLIGTG